MNFKNIVLDALEGEEKYFYANRKWLSKVAKKHKATLVHNEPGEEYQGSEGYQIYRYMGNLWKVVFSGDSYGDGYVDTSWSNPVFKVEEKQKTITVWE